MEDEELRGLPPVGDDLPAMEGSGEMASCDSGSSLGQSSLSQQLTNSGSESSRLQEVACYLSQLVGSYDTQTLSEACCGLADSIHDADGECLQLLRDKDVVGVVVKLMEELPTHYVLQETLCDILLQCNEQVELRAGIEDYKAYRMVLFVLKKHRDQPTLLGKALQTLSSIAGTTIREGALREAKAYVSVLAVLRDHPQHSDIQSGGLQALAHLLKSDSYAAATVVLQDDHKLVFGSLERHRDNIAVVSSALHTLEVICASEQCTTSLLDSPALQLAVEAAHAFSGDEGVVRGACGVVDVLAEAGAKHNSVQFQKNLEQFQVAELLVTIIQQYSAVLGVQISALSALGHILSLPLPSLLSLNMYHWLRLIHSAFETFGSDRAIQEVCCRCIARMMEKNQDLHHFIGRESPNVQFPLHDSVWLVLLEQTKGADPKVFQSVALAIYYLAVDSESLHRVLLEKGAAMAVLEGVREFLHDYSRDETSVEYGCRALVALIMQNCEDTEKSCLYGLNIVGDIITIMEMFKFDPGVISEVFGVIACLSNLTEFVETIAKKAVHRQILQAVRSYSHHPVLVESCLEVLIMLSQNKPMNQLLNEGDALDCTAAVMKHHINSPPIQRKGCLVVRLLSSAEHLTSQPLCVSLASVVVGALAQWRTEPEVEVEALVCAHKLCMCSEQMARALVMRDMHLLLFNMLYHIQDSRGTSSEQESLLERGSRESSAVSSLPGEEGGVESERDFILRVGTDILFTLACIHDFKQEMLATAIKDGLLEGVRVLVDIGADVNVGEGGGVGGGGVGGGEVGGVGVEGRGVGRGGVGEREEETPICLAVLSRMRNMVELLLDLGVSNVHAALKISRELELDDITGILLKCIALDRNGETVNLSGLELRTVKPQWLLPCLGVRDVLRHNRYHRRSFDHIKDLLMRRKSIGCIDDKTLELLRAEMEGVNSKAEAQPLQGGRTEETDSGVPRSIGRHPGHHRAKSGNVTFTPSTEEKDRLQGTRQSLSSPPRIRGSQGDRSCSPEDVDGPSPAQKEAVSPPRNVDSQPSFASTPKWRVSRKLFEPSLPTICATPVHTLQKFDMPPKWNGEGVDSSGEVMDSPTSPLAPVSPGRFRLKRERRKGAVVREDSRTTLVTSEDSGALDLPHPFTPLRRHHSKLSSLMNQRGSTRRNYYHHINSQDGSSSPQHHLSVVSSPKTKNLASVTPTLLLRRLSMWGKNRRQRKLSSLSVSTVPRPESPPARIYADFMTQSFSEESQEVVPIPTNVDYNSSKRRHSSGFSGDERMYTANRRSSTPHIASGLNLVSPMSDSTDGDGVFSPTGSTTGGSLSLQQNRRVSWSSSSSSTYVIPGLGNRSGTVDISLVPRSIMKEEYDVYLGSSLEERENITSGRLIRVLDMSSNSLDGLETMVGVENRGLMEQGRGEVVVKRLKGLHRLDLKQNQLCRLPRVLMRELRKLSILNLSCNLFHQMPAEAVLSPALTSLDLSSNKITTIPILPTLPNLTKLVLGNNLLTEFPAAINGQSLPHLRTLNLRSNQIASIVEEDLRLRDLEELYLSKNQITHVPERFMASMLALKVLDISHNQLELLPSEQAEDLVELTTLKVAYNKMGRKQAEFNHFITSAPVIRTVDATENELSLLPPPYAWKSCGLKDLKLNGNAISQLDLKDCGRFWPHLESLYIGQNRIREIPKEIGQLRTLSCLDISHNDIRHLPDEMGHLDHLFLLNLQGLNKLSLDPSLLKGPTKNITAFLKSRRVKSVPCYQMKMMVVGGPGRGKTTLLHQLLQEKMTGHPRNNLATLGVNVKQWSYQSDSKMYRINCWDFAGQEEFYSTHQCFLTCRSIYLVVYDISKGESELDLLMPWLLNIQARAPSSPVIIIGTHIDKVPKDDYDLRRLQMRTRVQEMARRPGFPIHLVFSEVDCFNDKMVATLRRKVKEQIDGTQLRGQKIMGGLVPHNYMLLEEVIQQERKRMSKAKSRFPVLTSERLRHLMISSKLRMEKAEQEQAIRFLHECGVLLHYTDVKSKLSRLFFLDPEWLCSLMAQIITVTEVNPLVDKQGLLQVRSLSHLLKEPKFPAEFMPEYICLLERFEVVLSQTSQTLLIPSRLPRKKPSSIILPPASPGSQIVRRYLFTYIPPGFWPRLVARLIAFPKRTLPRYIKGNLEGRLEVWAEGIYYFWSEQAFFFVESMKNKTNVLDIVVPTTMVGTKLLCSVVDNMEHLIDEWFPGLRDIDTSNGRDLVCPMALCPQCPISGDPYCFKLRDLQQVSMSADSIVCPSHGRKVILEQLAPDIVISDLDSKFRVLPSEFHMEESSTNLLGSGGFGAVYKATYRNRPVAVKIFSQKSAEINNTTPNYLLRLEVSILSQLDHPNVISLVGVCMRPKPMMLLEYAQLGSLRGLHPYNHLSNQLKHRIALQMASALAYLHKRNIIYRDLKADNVLIFSLNLVTKVNAKLSDYGIACTATEMGLTQSIGTRGCKAPELLKAPSSYTPYNEKVDVYSYGLLMFTVMSNGHKPHEELTDPYDIDKAIEEGRPIKDIEQYGCPPWPDMQDLITHCLHYMPNERPSAQEIFDRLCVPEFICLKRAVQMAYDCNMETVTVRMYNDKKGSKSVEVWMASTLEQQSMLSIMNLSEPNASPKGFMIPSVKVYSMVAVQSSHVLLGTETGLILVYDGYTRKKTHQFTKLPDAVLCLHFFRCPSLGSYSLFAGLAIGQLAIYDEYLIPCADAKPSYMVELGSGPIRSVRQLHDRLYTSCGQEVVVLRMPQNTVETKWRAVEEPHSIVTCVEVSQDTLWSAQSRSPTIHLWDMEDGYKHRGELPCDVMLRKLLPQSSPVDPRGARVTAMFLQPHPHSVMWVGLGSGYLLLFSATSRNPLMVVRRHVDAIRCLECIKVTETDKPVHLILSAGFGFRQRPGEPIPLKGTPETYGNLLVWDSIMPRMKTTFDDMRRHQEPYR